MLCFYPQNALMFNRDIIVELEEWKNSSSRKPLILRGARQVGKTTIVEMFASNYEQYIYLNLELEEDSRPNLMALAIRTMALKKWMKL